MPITGSEYSTLLCCSDNNSFSVQKQSYFKKIKNKIINFAYEFLEYFK